MVAIIATLNWLFFFGKSVQSLLMAQRGSEEFYGQAPLAENLAPVTAEESLPPLEDLVKRIPSATRDLLEELFRARFVTVKRVPKSALKS